MTISIVIYGKNKQIYFKTHL